MPLQGLLRNRCNVAQNSPPCLSLDASSPVLPSVPLCLSPTLPPSLTLSIFSLPPSIALSLSPLNFQHIQGTWYLYINIVMHF